MAAGRRRWRKEWTRERSENAVYIYMYMCVVMETLRCKYDFLPTLYNEDFILRR